MKMSRPSIYVLFYKNCRKREEGGSGNTNAYITDEGNILFS